MKRMVRHVWVFALLGFSCATVPQLPNGVIDARGNLTGDKTRTHLDIVEAGVAIEGNYFAFTVKAASRFPAPAEFESGKRVDYIWFVDADKNVTTGQSKDGNDFNLHLWIDSTGWHTNVYAVSDIGKAVGKLPRTEDLQISGEWDHRDIARAVDGISRGAFRVVGIVNDSKCARLAPM